MRHSVLVGALSCVFVVLRLFGAGYVSMWARIASTVSGEPSAAMAMFSIFCFGKGVDNALAGPINAGLLLPVVEIGGYGILKYIAVVVLTGACMRR